MQRALAKAQIKTYKKLCETRDNSRLLTQNGLYFIGESYNYNPEAIEQPFFELLPKICPQEKS